MNQSSIDPNLLTRMHAELVRTRAEERLARQVARQRRATRAAERRAARRARAVTGTVGRPA
ncbi:MAG TPA: hypothetical protein VK020_01620, partial [Microlunatus sp.]|nr:hypothetical protein [Microlunatus sp.]